MRIQIVSDLHLEFPQPDYVLPNVGADVIVLAGDIHNGVQGIEWSAKSGLATRGARVTYVPGNHEYYNADHPSTLHEMRDAAQAHGIHLLDCTGVIIDGVRFLGATLWSDFELLGQGEMRSHAMATAGRKMNDYHVITECDGAFTPKQSLALHVAARQWLESQLAQPFPGPTVVITHHAPHPESVPVKYRGNPLSPAFVSDLTDLLEQYQSELWIHGHLHDCFDYQVGRTRIVCNPRGYYPSILNPGFDPGLVIEI